MRRAGSSAPFFIARFPRAADDRLKTIFSIKFSRLCLQKRSEFSIYFNLQEREENTLALQNILCANRFYRILRQSAQK